MFMIQPPAMDSSTELFDRPLGDWTAELLSPLSGTVFRMTVEGQDAEDLELVSVSPGSEPAVPGGRVPFSLMFRSSRKDVYVPQGCRSLLHPVLGRAEVFLVPIGPDATGMRYEAVFS